MLVVSLSVDLLINPIVKERLFNSLNGFCHQQILQKMPETEVMQYHLTRLFEKT